MSAKPALKLVKDAKPLPFIDLHAQQLRIQSEIDTAIANVLEHGQYIQGPEVHKLEAELAKFTQSDHAITCSSGTDALILALLTQNLSKNDAVFVPAFTFVATAEAVVFAGGTPFFVDVNPDTFNLSLDSLKEALQKAKEQNLNPRGIIPVDLFGQPADYEQIQSVAKENNLWVIADAAQSFGAEYKGKPVTHWADMTCTSFFPAKPLGCYGDGGALFTNNEELAEIILSSREHGIGNHKYENVRLGLTGRLDTIQAAILLEKLKIFPQEIELRDYIAERYTSNLQDVVTPPTLKADRTSTWAQYTIKTDNRAQIQAAFNAAEIPSMIYYPLPLCDQEAYRTYPRVSTIISKQLSQQVLSLPMHPYLPPEDQTFIIKTLKGIFA